MSCCPPDSVPHLEGDYIPTGKFEQANGIRIYVVGCGTAAIILFPDIFGLEGGRTLQVSDELAAQGFTVFVPDVFRGKPWDHKNFPPADFSELRKWFTTDLDYETVVKADIFDTTIPLIQSKGLSKIGTIGFCWGAKMAILASTSELISAGAGIHPSLLQDSDAEAIVSPQLFAPAGNDPPIDGIKAILDTKPFGSRCVYHTFPEMQHGWSVRGDLSIPAVARDVMLVFEQVHAFFRRELLPSQ